MSLESLFRTPAALPVVPRVVRELITRFDREAVSIGEIAERIEADPVLCAKVLRLANSAYFSASRQIGTVDEALRLLGFVMVRNLVLGLGMAAMFRKVEGMDLRQFWRHSLNTACAARWLANTCDADADLAFTVGLMHGLGQLVMHLGAPQALRPLDRDCHPLDERRAAEELARLGYHHGDATAELALRWNFPREVAEALRAAVAPTQGEALPRVAAIVRIAAWRARVETFGWDAQQAQAACPRDAGRAAGLAPAWIAERATVGGAHPGAMPDMPPLAVLSGGLESMFS